VAQFRIGLLASCGREFLMNRMYKFKLHFNRINMQRGLAAVWTVHYRGQCVPAVNVTLHVPVKTTFRPLGAQPRAWFEGYGILERISEGNYVIMQG
jgi:hypothetical protein